MVQRLGRVNRRGQGHRAASVTVFVPPIPEEKEEEEEKDSKSQSKKKREQQDQRKRMLAQRAAIEALPRIRGAYNGSPAAITETVDNADDGLRETLRLASTEAPLFPALDLPTLEAWSMTSLREHSGRPEVAPWLRGWLEDEPQTRLLWRGMLPGLASKRPAETDFKRYVIAAPPHVLECLEVPTNVAATWLQARLKAILESKGKRRKSVGQETPWPTIVALNRANEVTSIYDHRPIESWQSSDLQKQIESLYRMKRKALVALLSHKTLLLFGIGGLAPSGLLDAKENNDPAMADSEPAWDGLVDNTKPPVPPFRVRIERLDVEEAIPRALRASTGGGNWRPWEHIAIDEHDDGERVWFVIDKWRDASTDDESRAIAKTSQSLEHHQVWTEAEVIRIASRLGLPAELAQTLAIAARWHDQGKEAECWQRAFSAPINQRPLAKTRGPRRVRLLQGYRHEFGSLLRAKMWRGLDELDDEHRELALHLVAAHHGFTRPFIATDGCEDVPQDVLNDTARTIALRFFRLQQRWTPWGLAWLESLLRAADQKASRRLEEEGDEP